MLRGWFFGLSVLFMEQKSGESVVYGQKDYIAFGAGKTLLRMTFLLFPRGQIDSLVLRAPPNTLVRDRVQPDLHLQNFGFAS